LLGGLRAERGGETVTRFRSQKFGALFAYLALFPQRVHTREELADLLWPDAEPEAARTNLRTALSSLRKQLEPPGTPAGSVLVTSGHGQVGQLYRGCGRAGETAPTCARWKAFARTTAATPYSRT
jgi:DNA-binding SARP family transcriptional activator